MAGVFGSVMGFGKLQPPTAHGYFTAFSRFAWSLCYIGLLIVTAYCAGLPDLPSSQRAAALTAVLAQPAARGGR